MLAVQSLYLGVQSQNLGVQSQALWCESRQGVRSLDLQSGVRTLSLDFELEFGVQTWESALKSLESGVVQTWSSDLESRVLTSKSRRGVWTWSLDLNSLDFGSSIQTWSLKLKSGVQTLRPALLAQSVAWFLH